MANQFNTTHHNTQTTTGNTPSQSQMIDEAVQTIARNAQAPLDMAKRCVMGALNYNTQTTSDTTAPTVDSNTLAYIQQLEQQNQQLKSQLSRQRIAHSDSITTSLCHLQSIQASLFALESVTFDNNPNFEDSREYTLFGTLEYLIKSYAKDCLNEQNQLNKGV